jgi:hypothetical protein
VWIVGVVEQGQPARHHPAGHADPVGEFLGLPAAVRCREHLAAAGVDDPGEQAHGLGLARPRRPDHRPHQIPGGQQSAYQGDLLGRQRRPRRFILATHPVDAGRACGAVRPEAVRRRRASCGGEMRVEDGCLDDDPGLRPGVDPALAVEGQQGVLDLEQLLRRVHRLRFSPRPRRGMAEQDNAPIGEHLVGEPFDLTGGQAVDGPGRDLADDGLPVERRVVLGQPGRAGEPRTQLGHVFTANRGPVLRVRWDRFGEAPDLLRGPSGGGQPFVLDGADLRVGQDLLRRPRTTLRGSLGHPARRQSLGHELGVLGLHLPVPGRERGQQLRRELCELGDSVAHRHPAQPAPPGQLVAHRRRPHVASGLHVGEEHLPVQRPPVHPRPAQLINHRPAVVVEHGHGGRVHHDAVRMQMRLIAARHLMLVGHRRQAQSWAVATVDGSHHGMPLEVAQRRLDADVHRRIHIPADLLIAEHPQQRQRLRRRTRHVIAQHHCRRHPRGAEPVHLSRAHQPPTGPLLPHRRQPRPPALGRLVPRRTATPGLVVQRAFTLAFGRAVGRSRLRRRPVVAGRSVGCGRAATRLPGGGHRGGPRRERAQVGGAHARPPRRLLQRQQAPAGSGRTAPVRYRRRPARRTRRRQQRPFRNRVLAAKQPLQRHSGHRPARDQPDQIGRRPASPPRRQPLAVVPAQRIDCLRLPTLHIGHHRPRRPGNRHLVPGPQRQHLHRDDHAKCLRWRAIAAIPESTASLGRQPRQQAST